MKITFVGNSVSIRVRPLQKNSSAFPFIVEKALSDKHTFSFDLLGGQMIDKYVSNPDYLFRQNADLIILNFGIVELSSRSVSRRFYDYLNYYTPKNKRKRSLQRIFKFLENRFRKSLVLLRGKNSWYNKELFLKDYLKLIIEVENKSHSKIIVLGINNPNERIENQLPGTKERVEYVNRTLKSKLNEQSIYFVDVNTLTNPKDRPDGIHYNSNGHITISNEIFKLIEKFSDFQND